MKKEKKNTAHDFLTLVDVLSYDSIPSHYVYYSLKSLLN